MIIQLQPYTESMLTMERKIRKPLSGLGYVAFPVVERCESGYYQLVHSGEIISELGEQIDGALRILRSQIRSFDVVGRVSNADGSLVFQMTDGRYFRLIDVFNAEQYVIGYEVVACRDTIQKTSCLPCPTNCKKVPRKTVYFARQQKIADSDIAVQISRRRITCNGTRTPWVDCESSKKFGLN